MSRSLLILLALILSLRVGANGQLMLAALSVGAILARLLSKQFFEISIVTLGLSVALLPCMGSPVLLCSSFVLIAFCAPRLRILNWGAPFLYVCAASTLVMLVRDVWAHDFAATLLTAGDDIRTIWINLRESVRVSPIPAVIAFEHTLRWFGLCLIGGVLLDRREQFFLFLRSMMIGFTVSVILGVSQLAQLLPFSLPDPGAFWHATGRPAFTSTDPNALGILALIVLTSCAVVLQLQVSRATAGRLSRYFVIICMVAALVGGISAASRTFFVGLCAWVFLLLWLRKPRYAVTAVVTGFALILGLNAIFEFATSDHGASLIADAPLGFRRLLASLSFQDLENTLASRIVFNQAAFKMWLDNPVFGVGIGQFGLSALPYLPANNGWSDNANNFFLGVLAETGMLGFAALIVPLRRVRLQLSGCSVDAAAARAILIILVTLLLGPHLAFDEVAISVGALLSMIEVGVPLVSGGRFFAFSLGLALLAQQHRAYGIYPLESDGSQWTSRHARFVRVAQKGTQVDLAFQILLPEAADYPVTVELRSDRGESRQIVQSAPGIEIHQVSFRCDQLSKLYLDWPCQLEITLDTSATWTPALVNQGVDRRNLGVRLINAQN